jgi:hypothetical protein
LSSTAKATNTRFMFLKLALPILYSGHIFYKANLTERRSQFLQGSQSRYLQVLQLLLGGGDNCLIEGCEQVLWVSIAMQLQNRVAHYQGLERGI